MTTTTDHRRHGAHCHCDVSGLRVELRDSDTGPELYYTCGAHGWADWGCNQGLPRTPEALAALTA